MSGIKLKKKQKCTECTAAAWWRRVVYSLVRVLSCLVQPVPSLQNKRINKIQVRKMTTYWHSLQCTHPFSWPGTEGRAIKNSFISVVGSLLLHFLFFSPYYMQIHQTAFFPLSPILSQRAYVLLQFDLTDMIPSCCLTPCTISIWHCETILLSLLYNTHLGATHTTTSSIGGVQIPIYLVSSTTDSL